MDMEKEDEASLIYFHFQSQPNQHAMEEKEELPVPWRFDDGYAEVEKNKEFLQMNKGEHHSDMERICIGNFSNNLQEVRIVTNKTDAEEKGVKKNEEDKELSPCIETEIEEGVNENYFSFHLFEEEGERECELKEDIYSEQPYICTDKNRKEIDNKSVKIGKTLMCTLCEKVFKHKYSLVRHLKIHTCEKAFKCNLCCYITPYNSALKLHLLKHNNKKPYKCNYCNYSAVYISKLNNHLRIHTGEKPFKCNVCEYKTSTSSALRQHNRKHSGEKPFKCSFCSYSTPYSSSLRSHLRIHT